MLIRSQDRVSGTSSKGRIQLPLNLEKGERTMLSFRCQNTFFNIPEDQRIEYVQDMIVQIPVVISKGIYDFVTLVTELNSKFPGGSVVFTFNPLKWTFEMTNPLAIFWDPNADETKWLGRILQFPNILGGTNTVSSLKPALFELGSLNMQIDGAQVVQSTDTWQDSTLVLFDKDVLFGNTLSVENVKLNMLSTISLFQYNFTFNCFDYPDMPEWEIHIS